jgi:hypothetical protein
MFESVFVFDLTPTPLPQGEGLKRQDGEETK